MKILIIEPFFSGSHKKWASSYQQTSQHDVDILSLPGRHWKWRMYGAAVSLAKLFKQQELKPDLIIASDMLDLATFVALVRQEVRAIPIILYFHENQITYPWSPSDEDVTLRRNNQYGFINYTSALVADHIFYNSQYHLDSFVGSLPAFLKQFPDYQELQNVDTIRQKSKVLYLGMNLKKFDSFKTPKENKVPILLWNHRWEYDKNPQGFYDALCFLKKEKLDFQLVMLGESYQKSPKVFQEIKETFSAELVHFGYAKDFETYAHWLWKADIFPVSSHQDFFGGSVVEAMYCQCLPLLPNRLAYPEHILINLRDQYLYNDPNDFHQKLKNAVLNFNDHSSNQSTSDYVSRYDWTILVAQYDSIFELLS